VAARQRLKGALLVVAHGALAVGTSHGILLVVEKFVGLHWGDLDPYMTRFFARAQLKSTSSLKIKMLTAAPPSRPVSKLPVNQRNRKYYTIHSNSNNAFTLKLNENIRTAIVGFRDVEEAALIGAMIETHYIEKKEWPITTEVGTLILPEGRLNKLVHIFIREWEFDDLKVECTRNILDMISVDEVLKKTESYSFEGNLFSFEAPDDFYKARFDEIYYIS
jgi:hypothetical protein